MTFSLYRHLLLQQPELPPMPGPLTYVIGSNGVHLWARRQGLEVLIPILPAGAGLQEDVIAPEIIHGLCPATPFVRLDPPRKVELRLVEQMLAEGYEARRAGMPVETLFFLSQDTCGWELWRPPQHQEPESVEPILLHLDQEKYAQVLIEVHTHPLPNVGAYFSPVDDRDECGCRLYGVLGDMTTLPDGTCVAEMRMRVVIYDVGSASYEFPASWVMELPAQVRECRPRRRPSPWERAALQGMLSHA
jgi:hypothetical protein